MTGALLYKQHINNNGISLVMLCYSLLSSSVILHAFHRLFFSDF